MLEKETPSWNLCPVEVKVKPHHHCSTQIYFSEEPAAMLLHWLLTANQSAISHQGAYRCFGLIRQSLIKALLLLLFYRSGVGNYFLVRAT